MDPQRIVIVGGHPDHAELAALTAALELHDNPGVITTPVASRWTRAARLEACGHPPIDNPTRMPR
ncbi:MAG TPA: acyl-CoA carboxylase epsilon subunit [Euzebyales bacterium]|nr:acyl-CoA carboxylase epsilon subunit [Euzebyales bacterium]